MSIRTKLLLSYIAMIIVPLVLFFASIALTASLVFRDVARDNGSWQGHQGHQGRMPFEAIGQWFGDRDEIIAGLKFVAEYDPAMLDNEAFVRETESRLSTFGSTIVIASGDTIKHAPAGVEADALLRGESNDDGYKVEEAVSFKGTGGADGKLVIATKGEPVVSFFRRFVPIVMLTLLLALVATNGVLTFFVSRGIIKPLNALKNAAEQIREGNLEHEIRLARKDEIGQLGATFEEMRQRLRSSLGAQIQLENNRKELLANISHDLKTPITAIQGCVDCLRDGVADTEEKRDKYIGMIGRKAADMDRLIEELFLFSTLDMKKLPFHRETIDADRYLRQTADELRLDPRLDGVEVTYRGPRENEASPVYLYADRQKLRRAIMNVVDNSLKHMDKIDKKIGLELIAGQGEAIIRLSDNGSGIPEEALPAIFERFYRADSSRNAETGGSGLGLAIVKQIIEEHGGAVAAESEEGAGTTISFAMPTAPDGKGESL